MIIESIQNGIVIDHIAPGRAMQLYSMLKLDQLDCGLAIIQKVNSRKMGKKDVIKIAAETELDFDVIGYLSPEATVNIIKDGKIVEKKFIAPPARLVNIVRCKNPRCITTTEQEIAHIFVQIKQGEYRCLYCDTKISQ